MGFCPTNLGALLEPGAGIGVIIDEVIDVTFEGTLLVGLIFSPEKGKGLLSVGSMELRWLFGLMKRSLSHRNSLEDLVLEKPG